MVLGLEQILYLMQIVVKGLYTIHYQDHAIVRVDHVICQFQQIKLRVVN